MTSLSPCRRRSLPVRGSLPHENWGREPTTWWLSSPNTPTVWESLSLPSNEPVSKKWRMQMLQCCNVNLITVIYLQRLLFSSYRVFARGLQSTSGPGRLLLSLCGLESAFISCPGLQTHLWTSRSDTHTHLCFYFPSISLSLPLFWIVHLCFSNTVQKQHLLFWSKKKKNWHQVFVVVSCDRMILSQKLILAEWRILIKIKRKRGPSSQ